MYKNFDLISIAYFLNEKFIKIKKKICLDVYLLVFLFFTTLNFHYLKSVDASVIKNDKLIGRISKDYTNKFCNSIAFGLSKDSAMIFAMKENNMIFKNKEGMDNLDKELLANTIAVSVVDRCGFLLDLNGERGTKEFTNDYLSMKKIISNSIK